MIKDIAYLTALVLIVALSIWETRQVTEHLNREINRIDRSLENKVLFLAQSAEEKEKRIFTINEIVNKQLGDIVTRLENWILRVSDAFDKRDQRMFTMNNEVQLLKKQQDLSRRIRENEKALRTLCLENEVAMCAGLDVIKR